MTISAVILAAGMSTRMGTPKMILPWGATTIVGSVVRSLREGGVEHITAVTGGAREKVETCLLQMGIPCCFNECFENGSMIDSIKTGLRQVDVSTGVLIALGDQPCITSKINHDLFELFEKNDARIAMTSYQQKRGHPWIIRWDLCQEILAYSSERTMRDFFKTHHADIQYLEVDTPDIFLDLDTPEDYEKHRPK